MQQYRRGSYYDQTIASWWRKEAENLAPSSQFGSVAGLSFCIPYFEPPTIMTNVKVADAEQF